MILKLIAQEPPSVTEQWMAGVVGMMLVFGVVALVGYVRQRSRERRPTE